MSLVFSVSSQNNLKKTEDQIPLKELLSSIEKEFDVRFSFDSELIEQQQCFPFDKEETLEEKLKFLAEETYLDFSKLDARYIVIKKRAPKHDISICGFLIDEASGLPIANATIWVEGKSIGTSSNEKGYFMLDKLMSDWVIRIDYLGYYSLENSVYKLIDIDCIQIPMAETNEELEEVLISDYLTQGMSKKRDGAIRVSPKNLGILPGLTEPDVLQSLQLLPGVQSPGETASDLHVRGGTPDQNLVLFDGIKMYESGHFFGLISSFNPYVTKKIEFYRSGTSAKYGDRIGGVLDISSGDAVPEFNAGFGLNLLHADAYVKTPLFNDKVGVILSGRRSLTDFWNTITYQKFSESVFQNTRIVQDETEGANDITNVNNSFFFHDYNLKVITDVTENDKLVFSNLYNNNNLEYYSENERFNEINTDNLAIKNRGSDLKWMRNWNEKWSSHLEINQSNYQLDYAGIREITRRNPENSSTNVFEKYNNVKDVGLKLHLTNRINEVSTWQYGYELSKNEVSYIFDNSNNNNEQDQIFESDNSQNRTHAFFTEYSLSKDQKWNLNLGLRANYFSVVKQLYLEPRFFVSNQLNEAFQLKFSAEIKNQVISQLIEFRNNGFGLENEIWALSDGDRIPVLNNYQVSAGFLFQKDGWNLDIDLYNRRIDGITILTEDVANRVPQYLAGKSTTNGVDVLLKKRFGIYRSWISYTLSKTKFQYDQLNDGEKFDGEYDIPHSLVWSHTLMLQKFEFSLGWKLRSGTPYTKGTSIEQTPRGSYRIVYEDEVNKNRLPVYNKIDLSATYKFALSKNGTTHGKFGISLMNIFNTRNILDRNYEIKTERIGQSIERTLVETDQISIGFTPNLVFRVDF
ncbi:TonB-dependent receptor [Flavicella marina]|uniref:TonB-dependent receptor n=1 Tax=Flavicella marina TaxID=1475951 RepID=UPI00186B3D42|nr:TonB-dependent receptor [Flavicella marina]